MATNVFNKLGQSVLPKVFNKLSGVGLTDLMSVTGETTTAGTGGGRIKSATTTVYSNIPCIFEPSGSGMKNVNQSKIMSEQEYTLKFPTHSSAGVRYTINPELHRLVIQARSAPGDEPQKTFRILTIKDKQGNLYEAKVVKED